MLPHRIEWSQRAGLREALRRYPLVHVPAPLLEVSQLIAMAAGLGRLTPDPRLSFRVPGTPQMIVVGNLRNEKGEVVGSNAIGQGFHSDRSFQKRPAELTVLYALATPERGGDTEFASFYRLYDGLDEPTRAAWAGLEVEYEATSSQFDGDPDRRNLHPLVRTHPDTGRRLVYASPPYMRRVIGLPEAESRAILDRVAVALEPPDVVFRWRPRDLLIWDNRAVAHRATAYDRRELRHLWRLSVFLDSADPEARA
jgi:taurine dioxygenase